MYIDRIAVDHTPIATLEQDEKSLENTPKVKEFTRESFSKNLGPHGEVENSQAIFSFHAYPKPQSSKPSVPSDSEDVREVTGIFGAQMVDTLGNENNVRTSTEGIIDKKKLAAEIPTPVFSAENRRNHSFLKSSESLVKLETT